MVHLLIADDEMLERAVLYKTLHKNLGERCVIFQAENGREALQIYEKHNIQVVILDIEMPGVNGIEAAERIREKDKDCCIIFLTAFDEFAYARKAITVRALDYLLKPYEEQELMLVVEEAIRLAEEVQKKKKDTHRESREPAEEYTMTWQPDGKLTKENSEEIPHLLLEETEELENSRLFGVREVITRYIHENYMYDISMQELARTMNYSEAYFCKLFKQCFGQNFISYLTDYRVEEAKRRLEEPTANIKEIGKAVGYGDSNYFTKVFRRITGVSPTEYRVQCFRHGK
ncbi:MAG: response regulator [Lachnospiraceae bacterium]|nr:response regulator [Lachnospiraceae bacterium]MCI9282422.1 response regulator [Lachnospiraceae bacterium]